MERKKEIELHFKKILKGAKTFEQIREYYQTMIGYLIPNIISHTGHYNYVGFDFYMGDMPIIGQINEEFNVKLKILNKL
jgi:hypothetical protein